MGELSNPGANRRNARIESSKVCEIAGRVWIPFFDSDKNILLDKCSMALRMYPHQPRQCLVEEGPIPVPTPTYEIGILCKYYTAKNQPRIFYRNPSS